MLSMSAYGTFRTSRGARLESAMRTKAEVGQRLQKNGRGQEAELRETRHWRPIRSVEYRLIAAR
jgi:hypothetical protein